MTPTAGNPWEEFRRQVVEVLRVSTGQDLSSFLELPSDPQHGDLASTASFHLAQNLHRTPAEIAKELAVFDPSRFPLIEQVVTQGPYVNFFVNIIRYRRLVIDTIRNLGEQYGTTNSYQGKHAVVEFPAVNPQKPAHIGHARNAVIGDTVARVLKTVGYDVTRMDYIDDLGLQMAVAYWGYKHLKGEKVTGKFDQGIGRLYVEAEATHDEDKVREYLRLMEEGDNEIAREVRAIAERTLQSQHRT